MGGVVDFAKKVGGAALPFLGPVGGVAAGLLSSGGGGGGGGGGEGGTEGMRQGTFSGLDPASQARQLHLWNQAQQYAAGNPFSQRYGGASAMPGMSDMSKAGQQYTTNAILGPGAYGAQNLGFSDYERPSFTYQPDYATAPPPPPSPQGIGQAIGQTPWFGGGGEFRRGTVGATQARDTTDYTPEAGWMAPEQLEELGVSGDFDPAGGRPEGPTESIFGGGPGDEAAAIGPSDLPPIPAGGWKPGMPDPFDYQATGFDPTAPSGQPSPAPMPAPSPTPTPMQTVEPPSPQASLMQPLRGQRAPTPEEIEQDEVRGQEMMERLRTMKPRPDLPYQTMEPTAVGPPQDPYAGTGGPGDVFGPPDQQQQGSRSLDPQTYGLTPEQIARGQRQTQQLQAQPKPGMGQSGFSLEREREMMQQEQQKARQSITPEMESQYATLQAKIQKEGEFQRANPAVGQSIRSPEEQKLLRTFGLARPEPQQFGPGGLGGLGGLGGIQRPMGGGFEDPLGAVRRGEQSNQLEAEMKRRGIAPPTAEDMERESERLRDHGRAQMIGAGLLPPTRGGPSVTSPPPPGSYVPSGPPPSTVAPPPPPVAPPLPPPPSPVARRTDMGSALRPSGADLMRPGLLDRTSAPPGRTGGDPIPTDGPPPPVMPIPAGPPNRMAALLGPADQAVSPTVGVGEMEQAATATRRLLEEQGPEGPTARTISGPSIGTTTVADVTKLSDPSKITADKFGGISTQDVDPDTGLPVRDIDDYMNTAGVDAQVAQAQEDYERELNALQAQQAGTGAFGARAQLEDLGALEAQQRNIAQIKGAGFDRAAQMMEADIGRGQEAGMQTQRLGTGADTQNAANKLRAAEQNMQSALQTGNQQAAISAQREVSQAQMTLDAATRNQAANLTAGGMGLDATGQFRGQQLAAARQLADVGGLTQGATFGAGRELERMGREQEEAQRRQQAFDYEQWLRSQQGGAQELALAKSFLPTGMEQQWEREPSKLGQVGGGLLSAIPLGIDIYDRWKNR